MTTAIDKRWLHPYEVRAMRRLRRQGEKVITIAACLGRDRNVVSAVLNRKTYSNVPDEVPTPPHPWDIMGAYDILQRRKEARTSTRKQSRVSPADRLRRV